MKYNNENRFHIPEDYECCFNCKFISWMIGIGQGVRCGNEKNQYKIFKNDEVFFGPDHDHKGIKLPVIPGVGEKCEHFEKTQITTPQNKRR